MLFVCVPLFSNKASERRFGNKVSVQLSPFLALLLPSHSLPSLLPFNTPMIKRMAGKLGSHLSHAHPKHQDYPSLPSPPSEQAVSPFFDYRGSISTDATTSSEWSKQRESLDIPSVSVVLPRDLRAARPQGAYRLTDFIFQRTLGTGSFGRVHLGEQHLHLSTATANGPSPEQTQPASLRDQGAQQGKGRQIETGKPHRQ